MRTHHKTAGLDVKPPQAACTDKKCPFHGTLKIHGRRFEGVLTNVTVSRSATLEFTRQVYIHKYERGEQRKSKIHVHNPPCINAMRGDRVRVAECRRLSKTKSFVIVENLGKELGFAQRQELLMEGKKKRSKKVKEELEAVDVEEAGEADAQ